MKFSSALTLVLASIATTVSAAPRETNADRLARGMPPMPPVRRSGTPAFAAKRQSPSGTPNQCNTGSTLCCNSTSTAGAQSALLGLLGVVIQDVNALVGLGCSPISVIGVGGNSCSSQPVCCSNNNFNGIIAIGCTPININL